MKKAIFVSVCIIMLLAIFSCKKNADNSKILIDFIADKTEIMAGDSVYFKRQASGNLTGWEWEFEGGLPQTSTKTHPIVIYNTPGKYKVKLTLRNKYNEVSLEKEEMITVGFNLIEADFDLNKNEIGEGESVTFTDKSKGLPGAWDWRFIHRTTSKEINSTAQNPTITFVESGVYDVILIASNPEYRDTIKKENAVKVLDLRGLAADFTSDKMATYEGGAILFEDKSMGVINERKWEISGPENIISTEAKPSFKFNIAGRYKVSLTVKNSLSEAKKVVDKYLLVVPANQLSALISFDNAAIDVGPNKIATQVIGSMSYAPGRVNAINNQSGVFNGSSGIVISNHSSFDFASGNLTVSLWVKTNSTNRMMLWQESGKNGAGDNQVWLRIGDNTTDRFTRFAIEDNTGSAIMNIGSAGKVSDNLWHHVVAVREGTYTKVYIDGALIKEMNASNLKIISNEQDFKIGMQDGTSSYSNFFKGEIDDFLVYKRALTEAEVKMLYKL